MRTRIVGVVGASLAGMMLFGSPAARAANDPAFRDCSLFASGIDPDFVRVFGVTVTNDGRLTVSPGQHEVQLEASESTDPGDMAGHVTLRAEITAAHMPSRTVSGAGVGAVLIHVPLVRAATETVSWWATFDNGMHQCPSSMTPANTPSSPNPFVISTAGR